MPVGRVAIIGARWRWRGSSDPPKYSGRPSDRCSESGSRPATRRCSNGSTRSGSQDSSTKAALDGIIGVGAGREAQRQGGDQAWRNSAHFPLPWPVKSADPTDDTDTSHRFSQGSQSFASASSIASRSWLRARRAGNGKVSKTPLPSTYAAILTRRGRDPVRVPRWAASGLQNG